MTGRRKSGRKGGSSKKESPEKSRRSSRRRGHKKSESEPENDSGSDRSNEDDSADNEALSASRREGTSSEAKGEESGGSDGAWQVRSENGNKGGIPKLKICLQRPSEMSSPTSDTLPSPRTRRSRRGGSPEVSEDGTADASTSNDVTQTAGPSESSEEVDTRPTRSRRLARDEVKDHEEDEEASRRLEEQESAARHLEDIQRAEKEREENEHLAREAEKERRLAEMKAEEERRAQIEEARKNAEAERIAKKAEEARLKEEEEKKARRRSLEEKERKKLLEEKEARIKAEEEERIKKETEKLKEEEREKKLKEEAEKEAKRQEEAERQARRRSAEEKESQRKKEAEKEAAKKALEEKEEMREESTRNAGGEAMEIQEVDQGDVETSRKRRSPSRDSSAERAKEEALRSRKSKKKEPSKEGSEDGEVVESPEREVSFPSRSGGRFRTTGSANTEESADAKENHQEAAPIVRKRRWGSSGSRSANKPPVSISTDVLKEIIPEAKPVALSEVQLSPNKEEELEEGETRSESRRGSKSESERPEGPRAGMDRRRRSVMSDESEKDYEEEGVESGGEEMVRKKAPENHVNHDETEKEAKLPKKEISLATRKVVPVDPLAALTKQKSPSPARHPPSSVLYITNLVRPFTVVQLRDLLARTGSIVPDTGFWIDSIKSRCYVKYTTEEEAVNTRNALHGVRWPASNPKQLSVDFATDDAMKAALEGGRPVPEKNDADRRKVVEERREREKEREKEREQRDKERKREREERVRQVESKSDERDRKVKEVERNREDKSGRTVRKVTVREWDLGKAERGFSPPGLDIRRIGDGDDDRRRRDKDRDRDRRRSDSQEPARKIKKKEEAPPVKILLDDLFRKTKATPSIYWLPLTTQQIAEKEEMRRKHMEEHEKQLAEQRKRQEAKRRRPRTKTRSRSPKK